MINYVNEDKFYAWYLEKARSPLKKDAVLARAYADYCEKRSELFRIPAEESTSGSEETYGFTVDNVGCCGASTIFVYF